MKRFAFGALAVALTVPVVLAADPAPEAKRGVTLTVYNGNYAMVKDVRNFDFVQGAQVIKFTDVASSIDATSVAFRSLTDPKTSILEQNYEYDLVNADKLLQKYIDKDLQVLCKDGKVYGGTLMSFDAGQLVLKQKDGKLVMVARADNVQNVEFGALPEGLITRPTLVWKVFTEKAGAHLAQVAYLTNNITWQADYTAVTNAKDTAVDFAGWVTMTNRSGARYADARIKLIAGDVHRAQPPMLPPAPRAAAFGGAMADRGGFEEKAFGEYHMYTLGRPSTVNDNQVKQIELIEPARDVPVRKFYQYTSGKKIQVYLEIKNNKESQLGIALPKGKVRVYKKDEADGSLEFIGEDSIDHTPKDEKVKLLIGDSFDLVAEYKVVSDTRISDRASRRTVEIKFRNHKDEDVKIEVLQSFGANWEIEKTSIDFTKEDAYKAKFIVPVKKDGETVLTYTVRTWY